MSFSHSVGKVLEATSLSTHRVSGDSTHISSSTSHTTKARVRWMDGSESFYHFDVDVSPGDQVIVIRMDGTASLERNLTTNQQRWIKRKGNEGCILGLCVLSIALVGIGLILTPLYLFMLFKKNKQTMEGSLAHLEQAVRSPDVAAYLAAGLHADLITPA